IRFQSMKTAARSSDLDLVNLIRLHQVGVWRYLRVLGCEPTQADDLTQETFLTVLEKPFVNINEAATAAYLRTVARNLFVSWLRREGKNVSLEEFDLLDGQWSRMASEDGGNLLMTALESCLETLRPQARQAVDLRFQDRRSRAEIAQALELTEDGAKNLLQRAKQRLKECIERKLDAIQ
ncbi:MAG: RNA polymerase sigma factor, partial [Planctomycetales bacterium]